MNIWILSDGKRGHLNQSQGLAHALLEGAQVSGGEHQQYIVDISDMSWGSRLIYLAKELNYPKPDLIIGAGHSTHVSLLICSRYYKALSIVCMKPSLPMSLFDLCVVPRHDLPLNGSEPPYVFPSVGALNAVKPALHVEKRHTLLLIGGESKEFAWDSEHLMTQIHDIARHSTRPLVLTTSRRTPADFIAELHLHCPSVHIVPVDATDAAWLEDHFSHAADIWVSQDSVSMVYEALATGAPVGVLAMPSKKGSASRVGRGLEMLIEEDRVTSYRMWAQTHQLHSSPLPLDEAKRAAAYILESYPHLLKR